MNEQTRPSTTCEPIGEAPVTQSRRPCVTPAPKTCPVRRVPAAHRGDAGPATLELPFGLASADIPVTASAAAARAADHG
jgi:hypothetical protein